MKRAIAYLLLITFFPACAVGPKYQRPTVDLPQKHRGQEGSQSAAEGERSFADLPWWEVFGDEELQRLIRTALENNQDLKIAAARVEEARGLYRTKKGDQFPEINFGTAGTQTFTTQPEVGEETNAGTINRTFVAIGGNLSYEADLWGKYRRGTEAARADLFAQEEFRQTVIMTLISDVARNYFEMRSLDLEREISANTAGARRKLLHLTRQRLKAGVISLLDVRQAEAELAVAETQIPRLEREIALKENQISLLLGWNPQPIARGKALTEQYLPPDKPLDLPSVLLERRPDIREAEQQLIAANARIGEAKALFFPQVNLNSFLGGLFLTGATGGWSGVASLGGSLFQFLFDGGKRKGNLQAVRARFEEAVLRYQKVIQQSLREVSDALISIKKFSEERQSQERLVRAARDGYRLSNARYEGGVSSYLEVLDAQRILFRSELQLVQVRRDQLIAVVQLYRALGGGWGQTQAEDTAVPKTESTPSKQ
jgi:multidrug efflux system outer membrane protein